MDRLKGKIAIVTGAAKGLGAAIAREMAAEGALVVVNYASSQTAAEEVVASILSKGGHAVAVQANVSKQTDIVRLFDETAARLGTPNVVVNNAGIFEWWPLEEITEDHFRKQFDTNVLGIFFMMQEAVKRFGGNGGSILNMSSIASIAPSAKTSVYSATKGAVDALSKSLAKELASRGIRVNTINPGLIPTEGVLSMGGAEVSMLKKRKDQTPLGRLGTPEDVAPLAVYLASDESSFITGESFVIAGGLR